MRNKNYTSNQSQHSLKLALLFLLSVTCLITLVLIIRIGIVISQSKYDAVHRFTIAVSSSKTTAVIYSFDKKSDTISILHVSGITKGPVEKDLGLLIDGTLPSDTILAHNGFISSLPELLFFHKTYNGLTGYDVIRMATFLKVLPPGNTKETTIHLPQSESTIQSILTPLFTDSDMVKENKSIRIINGTDVSGLGSRLERVITASGGNVIAIDSADTNSQKTIVAYSGTLSYTVKKLSSYLHVLPIKQSDMALSDIIVTIGEDSVSRNEF